MPNQQSPEVVGPDVLIPGSDQVLGGLGRLLVLAGLLAVIIVVVVRRRRPPERRGRPIGLSLAAGFTAVGMLLTVMYWPPPFSAPTFPALPRLLPEESLFYRTITDLPVAEQSPRWIASQRSMPLGSGFRSRVVEGVLWGNPFNIVEDSTPWEHVSIKLTPDTSFPGPYPITDPAYIEGMPTYHFDMHYLAVDLERREAWELLALRAWFGNWEADAGAHWSMDSLDYPRGSSIAAGLPLLPGTITYAEVESGAVRHALLGATPISAAGQHIWPARASDGRSEDPDAPPMGSWMRLRADADLSGLGPTARVIAVALQQHGLIVSDTGPGFGLRGTPDSRWDEADLDTLSNITVDDFEFVDTTSVMVSPDSMEAAPPAP